MQFKQSLANELKELDKKYWQLLSHDNGEFESCQLRDMKKYCQMSQCSQRRQYSVNLLQSVERWLPQGQCERPKTKFRKIEQRFWMKIEVVRVVVHNNVFRESVKHLMVQNPIILHDNASNHTAVAAKVLLRRWQWQIREHPPHSPDMRSMRLRSLRQQIGTARYICYGTVYEMS